LNNQFNINNIDINKMSNTDTKTRELVKGLMVGAAVALVALVAWATVVLTNNMQEIKAIEFPYTVPRRSSWGTY
jgi:hypothetical protein